MGRSAQQQRYAAIMNQGCAETSTKAKMAFGPGSFDGGGVEGGVYADPSAAPEAKY